MKTQPMLNDKQEWQVPVLEVIVSEKTEAGVNAADDGGGLGTGS